MTAVAIEALPSKAPVRTVELVSDASEFRSLESEWNRLADKFTTPLLRFEWFDACRERYEGRAKLAVFVSRNAGAVTAIAPLVLDRSAGIARLIALGHEANEPNGFLYADRESLDAVCTEVLSRRLPVLLSRIPIDSDGMRALRSARRGAGVMLVLPQSTAVARVPLEGGWAAVEAAMTAHSRANIRRRRKLAERDGAVTFEVVTPSESTVDRHLGEMFQVEASGWKSRAGTAILQDPLKHRFWTSYGRSAARLGMLRLLFLRLGADSAAVQMMVECGQRLWALKIAYDEHWSKLGPGILLMQEALRYACSRNLVGYECLGVVESWQQRWPLQLERHASVGFYPLSLGGGLGLGYDAARFAVQKARSARHRLARAARR